MLFRPNFEKAKKNKRMGVFDGVVMFYSLNKYIYSFFEKHFIFEE